MGWDSTEAATAAPVPRSVALPPPTLNAAKTAEPTIRIMEVLPFALTRTRCPTCRPSNRRVRGPRVICRGPAGAWPVSRVRNPRPRSWSIPIAGTTVPLPPPGAATLTCP